MVVDLIFDSLCRCFGVADGQNTHMSRESCRDAGESSPASREKGNRSKPSENTIGKQAMADMNTPHSHQGHSHQFQSSSTKQRQGPSVMDQPHQELAMAKLAATPISKKRKSATKIRDEIFRLRNWDNHREKPEEPPSNSFSRFLSSHNPGKLVNALCFATPIHDEDDHHQGGSNDIIKMESDCNTLNTAEDTITSTILFERKYAHLVENRPPMPLFSDFKVEDDQNELGRIVASDSHNSLKLIRLLGEQQQDTLMPLSTDLMKNLPKISLNELEDETDDHDNEVDEEEAPDDEKMGRLNALTLKDEQVPPVIPVDSSHSSSESSRP